MNGEVATPVKQDTGYVLIAAEVPAPGQMSGAPHFHEDEPVLELMEMASA